MLANWNTEQPLSHTSLGDLGVLTACLLKTLGTLGQDNTGWWRMLWLSVEHTWFRSVSKKKKNCLTHNTTEIIKAVSMNQSSNPKHNYHDRLSSWISPAVEWRWHLFCQARKWEGIRTNPNGLQVARINITPSQSQSRKELMRTEWQCSHNVY